jgi:two-component system CheB/CheR fusion protein
VLRRLASAPTFCPLNGKSRIFRRTESVLRRKPSSFPRPFQRAAGVPETSAGHNRRPVSSPGGSVGAAALRPARRAHNDKGDIFYVSGRTGKYLEPAAGKANWNLFAMAREGLRYELAGRLQEAVRKKKA